MLDTSNWLELIAKKTNPYPLIIILDANKIPPIKAQTLLDHLKALLMGMFFLCLGLEETGNIVLVFNYSLYIEFIIEMLQNKKILYLTSPASRGGFTNILIHS
jgi:hypothetical protein